MRVLICGSRAWTDEQAVWDRLDALAPDEVIHGGARGADTMADRWASERGVRSHPFYADWASDGKRAGILRNLAMLDEEPDLVIAFQLAGSRGTQHTIDEARRRDIPVEVFSQPQPVPPPGEGTMGVTLRGGG